MCVLRATVVKMCVSGFVYECVCTPVAINVSACVCVRIRVCEHVCICECVRVSAFCA